MIRPYDIEIDGCYQRDLDEPRMQQMVKAFDDRLLGVPVVSLRSNSVIAGVDGQHRIAMLRAKGLGDVPIMCEVWEGLSLKEEAQMFVDLQAFRKAIGALDLHRANVCGQDPTALQIERIVAKLGLKIGAGKSSGQICAVKQCRDVHMRFSNLETVLTILMAWAAEDANAYDGFLIKALGVYLHQADRVNVSRLIQQLKRSGRGPKDVVGMIKTLRGSHSLTTPAAMYATFDVIYGSDRQRKAAKTKSATNGKSNGAVARA
jgi:hypothetical protein